MAIWKASSRRRQCLGDGDAKSLERRHRHRGAEPLERRCLDDADAEPLGQWCLDDGGVSMLVMVSTMVVLDGGGAASRRR
ncbi:MAG: hypothetical protein K0V04_27665 [Deltaproteobacteria bacterium]|nr:hypothetical protein [Deltaproteobacteria bacterium]